MSKNNVVKAVIIGNSGVGKTALITRATNDTFLANGEQATVGGAHTTFTIQIDTGDIIFNIWDTAGQDEYRSVVPTYFQGAAVIIITYDVTNRDSFNSVSDWAKLVQDRAPEGVQTVLVANKIDIDQREISYDDGVDKSHAIGAPYFMEVSAKTGQGVQDLFELLAKSDEIRKDPEYMNSDANKGDDEPGCKPCNK